jgi:hypothetical protein
MDEYDERQAADAAWRFLRCNTTGTLRFGEHLHDVRYVICPDATMVISAMVAMLQPQDMVMYVPQYEEDCMEMHVSLQQFSESGVGGMNADRWQVYHGEPPDVQWARVQIDAARFHEMFIDGEAFNRENTLAEEESSLCKQLNCDATSLKNACKRYAQVDVDSPTMVGVDPLGIDVRARFGIVRLEAMQPFVASDEVIAFIQGSA